MFKNIFCETMAADNFYTKQTMHIDNFFVSLAAELHYK